MTSQTPVALSELRAGLESVGLRALAEHLEDFVARHGRGRGDVTKVLEDIVRIETGDRARRSLERRTTRSRVGDYKPMADFDWKWPKRLDREALERLLALRFLEEGANAILIGNHGLGKTMILKNIAHAAVQRGHAVLFVGASQLLNDLEAQETARALDRRIKHYVRFPLLCVDELGYLSYSNRAADLLFEIVNRRYIAKRPIALTTNLTFSKWTTVFPHATCTVALIDRLTHRADIVRIEGDSWRRKEAAERNNLIPE